MSTAAFRIASRLDRLGLRRALAAGASLAYPRQRFWVDEQGFWVNEQSDCTIVSPSLHTSSYAMMKAWVLDTWCFLYTPKPGGTVVDVGSGVGEEAIVFSKLVGGTGQVHAFEAHPQTFACLSGSIARSRLNNVVAHHCAVSDVDGEAEIVSGENHLSSSSVTGQVGFRVSARSLDSLLDELHLGQIDFLKMNIEGAERLAVQGMTRVAGRIRNLCISCHDFIADQTGDDSFRSREAVLAFLTSAGFEVSFPEWTAETPWRRDYLFAQRR